MLASSYIMINEAAPSILNQVIKTCYLMIIYKIFSKSQV